MSTYETTTVPGTVLKYAVFVAGLAITAMSMSSGFIWASQGKVTLVYVAGFFSWTGYIVGHYAVTGVFVDGGDDPETGADDATDSDHDATNGDQSSAGWSLGAHVRNAASGLRGVVPDEPHRVVGFAAGVVVLVAGIAVLAFYVRQGNHLMGNLGSGMFLGGYALAHYFDHGVFL